MATDLRPGMPVKVINQKDTYFGFEGQVQKVVDGAVGVIFTNGNWAKQVRFWPEDLQIIEARGKKRK
jgi:hypothetical protein